jgi:protein-disulfide isomerase
MKRYLPFVIIVVVAALTVFAGAMMLRADRRALAAQKTAPVGPVDPKLEAAHARGAQDAKVTVDEYGDFQCPSCAKTTELVNALEQEYAGKLKVVFWQFPLPMHAHSRDAALAAEAASRQGRFWEMHDLLYKNQNSWAHLPDPHPEFEKYAGEIGLDVDRYRKALRDPAVMARVDAEHAQGVARGVKGTPTFFINWREFPPPFTPERFREALNAALAAK